MEKSGIEPDRQRLQGAADALPVIPIATLSGHGIGRREPGEPAVLTGFTTRVDRLGFEPRTFSLQGSCSDQLELAAQGRRALIHWV